jgi:hypothetical protein
MSLGLCGAANACQPDDFLAEVVVWGESRFAGVVMSRCAQDAEVTLRVRLMAERAVWVGTTKVVVHAQAQRPSVFEGSFPAKKIARANPRFNSTQVMTARALPAAPSTPIPQAMPIVDFAELARAGSERLPLY